MASPRKTATTTLDERMHRAVESEFLAAAAARWNGAREEFLWRCRRCLEALLYALLLGKGAKVQPSAKGPKTLDDLLKHDALEELMPREMRDHAESVRKYGNTGTHFQVDGDVSEASASITASAFAEVLRWYFTRDGADLPAELERAQRALTDPRWRIQSPLESTLDHERARAEVLQSRLNAQPVPLDAPVGAPRARLAPWGLGLCAALFTGALGYALGGSAATPSPPNAVESSAAPTVTTAGTIEPTPVPPPAIPAPLPTAEPTVARSPDASVAPIPFPAEPPMTAMVRCSPSQRSARAEGRSFCIDAEPVTTREYRRCVDRGGCVRPAPGVGCNWQNGSAFDRYAANCVTREQAVAYCATRPEGPAALPTRAEWQAVRTRRDIVVRDDTDEWTADDTLDGRARTRGARAATDFVWTSAPTTRGSRSVSFRCVVR